MIFRLSEGYFRDVKVDRSMIHRLLRFDVLFSSKQLLDKCSFNVARVFSFRFSLSVAPLSHWRKDREEKRTQHSRKAAVVGRFSHKLICCLVLVSLDPNDGIRCHLLVYQWSDGVGVGGAGCRCQEWIPTTTPRPTRTPTHILTPILSFACAGNEYDGPQSSTLVLLLLSNTKMQQEREHDASSTARP